MDTSLANLESSNRFHRFHEELNRVLKINVIALTLLKQQLDKGISEDEVKQIMYDSGELWGGMPSWKNPYELIDQASNDLGQSGVFRVFSAFDTFLTTFEAELESWSSFLKDKKEKVAEKKSDDEDADRLFKLIAKNSWKIDNEKHIKPIYNYYRLSRNCIAHRNGLASTELSNESKSHEIKDSISNWKTFNDERTPPRVQQLEYGDKIIFTHQDAILASSITRKIALNLGQIIFKEIGLDGLVFLNAQKYLLREKNGLLHDTISHTSQYISYLLLQNNRVIDMDPTEAKAILYRLGIFEECKKKFKKLR